MIKYPFAHEKRTLHADLLNIRSKYNLKGTLNLKFCNFLSGLYCNRWKFAPNE